MTAPRDLICADTSRLESPVLCVIIDTEEEFDWAAPFSRRNVRVESLASIGKGQAIFESFGIEPTYLVDYPVIANQQIVDVLGPWVESRKCQVGAQLHPWVTPPFEEVVCPYNSYPCNLPEPLERQKLMTLKTMIEETLGCSVQVYKAGRYGLDIRREAILRELGFLVDTSVVPHRSNAGVGGGPNFFGYPDRPFWTTEAHEILFLPVSQHLVGPLRWLRRLGLDQSIFGPMAARFRLPGIMAHLGLLERIMLTPEGISLDEMRRLVRSLLRSGYRVFALSLHSPSFMPGRTPYVRSAQDLDNMLRNLNGFLSFFFGEVGGRPTTPLELKRLLDVPR